MLLLLSRMILMIQTADNVQHLGHNDLPYAAHSQLLPLLSNTLPMDRWNNYIGQVNNVNNNYYSKTDEALILLSTSVCQNNMLFWQTDVETKIKTSSVLL